MKDKHFVHIYAIYLEDDVFTVKLYSEHQAANKKRDFEELLTLGLVDNGMTSFWHKKTVCLPHWKTDIIQQSNQR